MKANIETDYFNRKKWVKINDQNSGYILVDLLQDIDCERVRVLKDNKTYIVNKISLLPFESIKSNKDRFLVHLNESQLLQFIKMNRNEHKYSLKLQNDIIFDISDNYHQKIEFHEQIIESWKFILHRFLMSNRNYQFITTFNRDVFSTHEYLTPFIKLLSSNKTIWPYSCNLIHLLPIIRYFFGQISLCIKVKFDFNDKIVQFGLDPILLWKKDVIDCHVIFQNPQIPFNGLIFRILKDLPSKIKKLYGVSEEYKTNDAHQSAIQEILDSFLGLSLKVCQINRLISNFSVIMNINTIKMDEFSVPGYYGEKYSRLQINESDQQMICSTMGIQINQLQSILLVTKANNGYYQTKWQQMQKRKIILMQIIWEQTIFFLCHTINQKLNNTNHEDKYQSKELVFMSLSLHQGLVNSINQQRAQNLQKNLYQHLTGQWKPIITLQLCSYSYPQMWQLLKTNYQSSINQEYLQSEMSYYFKYEQMKQSKSTMQLLMILTGTYIHHDLTLKLTQVQSIIIDWNTHQQPSYHHYVIPYTPKLSLIKFIKQSQNFAEQIIEIPISKLAKRYMYTQVLKEIHRYNIDSEMSLADKIQAFLKQYKGYSKLRISQNPENILMSNTNFIKLQQQINQQPKMIKKIIQSYKINKFRSKTDKYLNMLYKKILFGKKISTFMINKIQRNKYKAFNLIRKTTAIRIIKQNIQNNRRKNKKYVIHRLCNKLVMQKMGNININLKFYKLKQQVFLIMKKKIRNKKMIEKLVSVSIRILRDTMCQIRDYTEKIKIKQEKQQQLEKKMKEKDEEEIKIQNERQKQVRDKEKQKDRKTEKIETQKNYQKNQKKSMEKKEQKQLKNKKNLNNKNNDNYQEQQKILNKKEQDELTKSKEKSENKQYNEKNKKEEEEEEIQQNEEVEQNKNQIQKNSGLEIIHEVEQEQVIDTKTQQTEQLMQISIDQLFQIKDCIQFVFQNWYQNTKGYVKNKISSFDQNKILFTKYSQQKKQLQIEIKKKLNIDQLILQKIVTSSFLQYLNQNVRGLNQNQIQHTMSYSDTLISLPILKQFTNEKNKLLSKDIFNCILKLGGQKGTTKTRTNLLRQIIIKIHDSYNNELKLNKNIFQDSPILNCDYLSEHNMIKDQIFLQLIKQLFGNQNSYSIQNILQILSILTRYYYPSPKFIYSFLFYIKATMNKYPKLASIIYQNTLIFAQAIEGVKGNSISIVEQDIDKTQKQSKIILELRKTQIFQTETTQIQTIKLSLLNGISYSYTVRNQPLKTFKKKLLNEISFVMYEQFFGIYVKKKNQQFIKIDENMKAIDFISQAIFKNITPYVKLKHYFPFQLKEINCTKMMYLNSISEQINLPWNLEDYNNIVAMSMMFEQFQQQRINNYLLITQKYGIKNSNFEKIKQKYKILSQNNRHNSVCQFQYFKQLRKSGFFLAKGYRFINIKNQSHLNKLHISNKWIIVCKPLQLCIYQQYKFMCSIGMSRINSFLFNENQIILEIYCDIENQKQSNYNLKILIIKNIEKINQLYEDIVHYRKLYNKQY